jgi:hypothetical protein
MSQGVGAKQSADENKQFHKEMKEDEEYLENRKTIMWKNQA